MNLNLIPKICWGQETLEKRGVVISGYDNRYKNSIGAPFGAFSINRALAAAIDRNVGLNACFINDSDWFLNPPSSWLQSDKIISLDPWGCLPASVIEKYNSMGIRIYPSIAGCRAKMRIREVEDVIQAGLLSNDGQIVKDGCIIATKFSIEPVWHLPGIAKRLGVSEVKLRKSLYNFTGCVYSELLTNPEMEVFLPPYGNITVICVGDVSKLRSSDTPIGVRVHDECNSSDVFGSTICTCRPYLVYSLIEMAKLAQNVGVGVLIYNRQEGKGFGEVSKFQVYNSRNMSIRGQDHKHYYDFTKDMYNTEDLRFHEFCCDPLLWLGIDHIDYFYSMSPTKYNAIVKSGIKIRNQVGLPEHLIDHEAVPEITAKKLYGGYYSHER